MRPSTTTQRAKRYTPVAVGATLLLALSACSAGGGTAPSPSVTATRSASPTASATGATSATPSPTRTVTVTESTSTPGNVQSASAEESVTPGTISTPDSSLSASASASTGASATASASSTSSLSDEDVKSAGGSCGTLEATGYLKHNATIQVTSGAVHCLFAKELVRQFVVQNPAEVTDKPNGERTVMSARCYWKPGDAADRAVPECASLDGGNTVITGKLTK